MCGLCRQARREFHELYESSPSPVATEALAKVGKAPQDQGGVPRLPARWTRGPLDALRTAAREAEGMARGYLREGVYEVGIGCGAPLCAGASGGAGPAEGAAATSWALCGEWTPPRPLAAGPVPISWSTPPSARFEQVKASARVAPRIEEKAAPSPRGQIPLGSRLSGCA